MVETEWSIYDRDYAGIVAAYAAWQSDDVVLLHIETDSKYLEAAGTRSSSDDTRPDVVFVGTRGITTGVTFPSLHRKGYRPWAVRPVRYGFRVTMVQRGVGGD